MNYRPVRIAQAGTNFEHNRDIGIDFSTITTTGDNTDSAWNSKTMHDDLRGVVPYPVAGLVVDGFAIRYALHRQMVMQGDQFLGLGVIRFTGRAEGDGLGIGILLGAIRLRC